MTWQGHDNVSLTKVGADAGAGSCITDIIIIVIIICNGVADGLMITMIIYNQSPVEKY